MPLSKWISGPSYYQFASDIFQRLSILQGLTPDDAETEDLNYLQKTVTEIYPALASWLFDGDRAPVLADPHRIDERFLSMLKEHIDDYMDKKYPPIEPEIVHTLSGKEYFLPALKVLERDADGTYYSPQKHSPWLNDELVAECLTENHRLSRFGYVYVIDNMRIDRIEPQKYTFPHEPCTCGIYGSANLHEIKEWMSSDINVYVATRRLAKHVLCIIEPSAGAEVILCRKGWKAGAAFISEIIGETMDVEEASMLMSIAWKRTIDIGSIL